MEQVKGVIVCIYKKKRGYPRFAVLKRVLNWEGWELVKGHIDDGETPEKAAIREIEEETGITPKNVSRLGTEKEWTYNRDGKKFHATYDALMAEVPENSRIDISGNDVEEHSKGLFLNYRDSHEILTYDQHKEILEEAYKKIKK